MMRDTTAWLPSGSSPLCSLPPKEATRVPLPAARMQTVIAAPFRGRPSAGPLDRQQGDALLRDRRQPVEDGEVLLPLRPRAGRGPDDAVQVEAQRVEHR